MITNGSGSDLTTGQITVAATATVIVPTAGAAGRLSVTIVNNSTVDVFLGGPGVTISNGLLLVGTKGASITLNTSAAVYGIVATSTESVSFASVT